MGVQGLTTYVEGNSNFLQEVRFRDSRLVIDGCSLYYRLYFNHGLDRRHGGDYDAFARLLIQFLSALTACNIQPYVILDGGIDPSDKKFATLRQRLQSKIKEADSLAHGHNSCVLPILTRPVFVQVLNQRGIPLVQCPAEADWEIACLAHQWKCPVLTYDSDFYIYDLPGGYLPLSFFQWTNLNGNASQRYISAQRYTTTGLCRWFGGMNQELLPLCAVLAGNDYSTPKDVETLVGLLDGIALGKGGRKGKGSASTSRIEGFLLWLSSFSTVAEALEEVSRLMGEEGSIRGKREQKSVLISHLLSGMQEYQITPQSSLALWFSGSKEAPGQASGLPECLLLPAAQGKLAPFVVDAFVMHRVMLIAQVENSKLASSHCSASTIRQAIYGILLQKGQDVQAQDVRVQENSQGTRGRRGGRGRGGSQVGGGRGQGIILPKQQGVNPGFSTEQAASAAAVQAGGSSTPLFVEEYDRVDLNLKKKQVDVHLVKTPLHLNTLGQAPVAVRLGALFEVLGTKESALGLVPLHLRLAVAVTAFWLREATPPPSQHHLQALVLGMVYGELSWNNRPGATHSQRGISQPNWAAERSVRAGLDRHRLRPMNKQGLDVGAAHSFSQWQACLWSALCLNQLLLLPLPQPHLSWLYSGTLMHGLLRSLKGGQSADLFLVGGPLSGQLYSSLLAAVRNCSSKTRPSSSAAGRRKRGGGRGRGRGRGGGGRGGRGGGRGTEEINNRFALLMNEEESDDDS